MIKLQTHEYCRVRPGKHLLIAVAAVSLWQQFELAHLLPASVTEGGQHVGPPRQQEGSVWASAFVTVAWLAELGCFFCYTVLGSELMQQEVPYQQLCQMLMQVTHCQQR